MLGKTSPKNTHIWQTLTRPRLSAILLLWMTVWCSINPVRAQTETPSPTPTPKVGASTPTPDTSTPSPNPNLVIPLAQITTEADSAAATLQAILSQAESNSASIAVTEQLPDCTAQITARLQQDSKELAAPASLDHLRLMAMDWRNQANDLDRWRSQLADEVARLDSRVDQLTQLKESWQQTLHVLGGNEVPPELRKRSELTLSQIEAALIREKSFRLQVLGQQDQLAVQGARLAKGQAAVEAARAATVNRIFKTDSPPLFTRADFANAWQNISRDGRSSISIQISTLRDYVDLQLPNFLVHAAIFGILVLVLRAMSRRVQPFVALEPVLAQSALVFQAPVSTAMVIAMFAAPMIYPNAPQLLLAGLGAAALGPTLVILKQLLEPEMRPILYNLMLFYSIDLVRTVAAPLVYFSRILFSAELAGALLFCMWLWRAALSRSKPGTPRILAEVSELAAAFATVALLANLIGSVTLSDVVGNSLFEGAYLAVILYALVKIDDGLLLFALRVPPLALLSFVRNHRARIRRRARQAVELVAALLWVYQFLELLSLRSAVFKLLSKFLENDFHLGALQFSVGDLLAFGLTVWGSFFLSRLIKFVLEEDVYPRMQLARGLPYAISTTLHYVVLLVGFLVAIAALGVDASKFAVLAGAFGVGLGLGLQTIVNNFVSGLILLFERPINVGDVIQFGDFQGTLRRIGLRASILKTPEGSEVIVPNAQLITEKVINWTLSDSNRRIEIKVGVACNSRPETVMALLVKVARSHPEVLAVPSPQALFVEFGDCSLNFKLQAWTAHAVDWLVVQSQLMVAVETALREASIEVPFPRTEVRLLSDHDCS